MTVTVSAEPLTIQKVSDYGSIVVVILSNGRAVCFDHRSFRYLPFKETDDLIGQPVEYKPDAEAFGGGWIRLQS